MRRLFVRRSLTAVGIYSSVVLGFLGTVVATREFALARTFGDYATVIFATGFFQSLFDLTVEEALVKYGFRYVARGGLGAAAPPLLERAVGSSSRAPPSARSGSSSSRSSRRPGSRPRCCSPPGFPLGQSLEGLAGAALYLRSRYDIRSLFLGWSMALRLAGIAVGAHYGLAAGVAGVLVAQVVATASSASSASLLSGASPQRRTRPLGDDRREIGSFILQSSAATGVLSLRERVLRRCSSAPSTSDHPGRSLQGRSVAAVGFPGAVGACTDGAA